MENIRKITQNFENNYTVYLIISFFKFILECAPGLLYVITLFLQCKLLRQKVFKFQLLRVQCKATDAEILLLNGVSGSAKHIQVRLQLLPSVWVTQRLK